MKMGTSDVEKIALRSGNNVLELAPMMIALYGGICTEGGWVLVVGGGCIVISIEATDL